MHEEIPSLPSGRHTSISEATTTASGHRPGERSLELTESIATLLGGRDLLHRLCLHIEAGLVPLEGLLGVALGAVERGSRAPQGLACSEREPGAKQGRREGAYGLSRPHPRRSACR